MLNIPDNFFLELISEIDLSPILFLDVEDPIDQIITLNLNENEDTVLKLLQMKLILIYKNKSNFCDFNVTKLLENSLDINYTKLHDVLLYALLIQNSSEVLKELVNNSYDRLSKFLNDTNNNSVLRELEIMDVIMEVSSLTNNDYFRKFDKEKSFQEIMIRLVCSPEKEVQKKVVIDVIPKYVQYLNNDDIFSKIWEKYQDHSVMDDLILSGLEKYFIPQSYSGNQFTVLKQDKFWKKLQLNIVDTDHILKRQSMYILKQAVGTLFSNESYKEVFASESTQNDMMVKWNADLTSEYEAAWHFFFVLCDTASEKTLHLIEPTLKLYNSLEPLHNSWKLCITKLFIHHSHPAVISLTLTRVLNLEWICDIESVIVALSNNFLFENKGSLVRNDLYTYIKQLTKEDFELFVNTLQKIQPGPVPFYFITSGIQYYKLAEPNLMLVRQLLSAAKNIPHTYIRTAVYNRILNFFTNMHIYEELTTNKVFIEDFMNVIYTIFESDDICTKTCWKTMTKWMKENTEFYKSLASYILQVITDDIPTIVIKGFSIFVAMCIDINSSHCLVLKMFQKVFRNIEDIHVEMKFKYLIFISSVIRVIRKMSISQNIIEDYHILWILFKTISICCTVSIHEWHIAFFNEVTMIIDLIGHIYNMKIRLDLINNFLQQLVNSKKYINCLMFSASLLNWYPSYNMFHNEEIDKVYYLQQSAVLMSNIKKAKCNFQHESYDLLAQTNMKHIILSNYYHTMVELHKLMLQTNSDASSSADILRKINTYFDKGGPDIILPILDCILAIANQNPKLNELPEEFWFIFSKLLHRCYKEVFYLKSNKLFSVAMLKFIKILTHSIVTYRDELHSLKLTFYSDVYENTDISSLYRIEILKSIKTKMSSDLLAKALLYGPVLRKDQRIEFDTSQLISYAFPDIETPFIIPADRDRMLRMQAVCILSEIGSVTAGIGGICYDLIRTLISRYEDVARKRYYLNSQVNLIFAEKYIRHVHVFKLRILQILHLLIIHQDDHELLQRIQTDFLQYLMSESNQPDVKILIQWLVVKTYFKLNDKKSDIIEKLIRMLDEQKKRNPICLFPLLFHLLKCRDVGIKIVHKVMILLLSFTMGQHFHVRYYAQVAIKKIYEMYESDVDFAKIHQLIYKTVCDVIKKTDYEKSADLILAFMTLESSLETIFYHIPRICNTVSTEWIHPQYFLDNFSSEYHRICPPFNTSKELKEIPTITIKSSSTEEYDEEGTTVQKKIDTYTPMFKEKSATSKGNLIVVASLINCEPNLGGLNRTCEIFGVKQYVVNNIHVLKSREYQNLSKSSEKWVETKQVNVSNLPTYLKELKKIGYRIVGAEQTNDSINLNEYAFEKDTALVLGNEREGIPPNLIHILDECIEVPQYGQIRSLNVHVTGSLCIWEYVKQHIES